MDTYVVGEVALIWRYAATLSKKLKIPATSACFAKLTKIGLVMPREVCSAYSPFNMAMTAKIGPVTTAVT